MAFIMVEHLGKGLSFFWPIVNDGEREKVTSRGRGRLWQSGQNGRNDKCKKQADQTQDSYGSLAPVLVLE